MDFDITTYFKYALVGDTFQSTDIVLTNLED
jgi:hypothetical protein